MQRSSLAPVLSATRSRDSCWITGLLGLLENLREAPRLRLGDRPRLDDADDVSGLRHVRLVMGVELARATNDLLVDRVRLHRVDADDDRLVHRRGDDDTAPLLALAAHVLGLRKPGDRLPLRRALALRLRTLTPLRSREPLLLRLAGRLRGSLGLRSFL